MARKEHRSPTAGLVLVRLTTGLVLLVHGWRWLATGEFDGALVRDTVDSALVEGRGLLDWWGRDVLLSNPDAIAFLGRWVAFVTGACLTLGALTRPMAVIAAFFLLNAWQFGSEGHEILFLVLATSCIACAVSRAGRKLGLDSVFDQHFPAWLTWTRRKRSFLD